MNPDRRKGCTQVGRATNRWRKSKPKGETHGNASTSSDGIQKRRGRRTRDSGITEDLRRRAAVRENGAGERAPRDDLGGVRGAGIWHGKRRPHWHPPGQSLGADGDRPLRSWWSQATTRGAAVAEWQLPRGEEGWHAPQHAFRFPG